jgi:abortive infection bacteriophage resistance protein
LERLKEEIKRSDEKFLKHYFSKYSEDIPPAWIALEIASFGLLSLIFNNLKSNKDMKEIASKYELTHVVFISWLHSLTYIRNVCAHHSRLWNRELGIQPIIPKHISGLWLGNFDNIKNDRVFISVAITIYFLSIINPKCDFKQKLYKLFENYPMIDLAPMGFPKNWKGEELFK